MAESDRVMELFERVGNIKSQLQDLDIIAFEDQLAALASQISELGSRFDNFAAGLLNTRRNVCIFQSLNHMNDIIIRMTMSKHPAKSEVVSFVQRSNLILTQKIKESSGPETIVQEGLDHWREYLEDKGINLYLEF